MRISFRRNRGEGLTLVEIICAMSVLFIGCLFVFKMFHLAIYSSGTIGDDALALVIAQRKMEEIRGWAYEKSGGAYNFNNGNWAAYDNREETDPLYPRFSIHTYNCLKTVKSPSGTLVPRKSLISSARLVKVEVTWRSGAGSKKVTLISLIGEPCREIARLDYEADRNTLDKNEKSSLKVKAIDDSGNEIPDLVFHWHVAPETANGTPASTDSLGAEGSFTHQVITFDGKIINSKGGTCRVYAVTRTEDTAHYSIEMKLNP